VVWPYLWRHSIWFRDSSPDESVTRLFRWFIWLNHRLPDLPNLVTFLSISFIHPQKPPSSASLCSAQLPDISVLLHRAISPFLYCFWWITDNLSTYWPWFHRVYGLPPSLGTDFASSPKLILNILWFFLANWMHRLYKSSGYIFWLLRISRPQQSLIVAVHICTYPLSLLSSHSEHTIIALTRLGCYLGQHLTEQRLKSCESS
jgi:hypothetical protein